MCKLDEKKEEKKNTYITINGCKKKKIILHLYYSINDYDIDDIMVRAKFHGTYDHSESEFYSASILLVRCAVEDPFQWNSNTKLE